MSDYFDEMGWTPLGESETPDNLILMARFFRDSGMWEMVGEHERLPPPAAKEAIDNLKEIEIKSGSGKLSIFPQKMTIKSHEI